MNTHDNDNILTMRDNAQSEVITMPSQERSARSAAVVVQMPSRGARAERSTAVITMPTRIDSSAAYAETKVDTEEPLRHLPSAFRLTLLALFAWLGWPRPTHGKGPGAAGARPWKPSLLSLISTLHLPGAAPKPARAAVVVELPVGRTSDLEAISLRAA